MFKSLLFSLFIPIMAVAATPWTPSKPFHEWSLDQAVEVLNDSPWARHETFTRVIGGVGSGVSGEKEIFNTFYVRFLSARPIREAYARVQQIQYGYDKMSPEMKADFKAAQSPNLDLDVSKWIVVSISFRSNDPNEESSVRRFFQSATVKTLKSKAFLSTPNCSQVEISAYFPQREESVGPKLVFPRIQNGIPVISKDCAYITLELLDVPGTSSRSSRGGFPGSTGSSGSGSDSRLRTTFKVEPMIVDDQLIF